MLSAEERAFLAEMAAKHLPGRHDQRSHGRSAAANRELAAAQELDELRESIGRMQARTRRRENPAAADERLVARRSGLDPARAQQTAQGRARLRQARIDLARDRASILADAEEILSINEGDPDKARKRFRQEVERLDLADDPRLAPLEVALRDGDTASVRTAVEGIAESAGLQRIGGDPERGYDQLIGFNPRLHQSIGADRPSRGQLVRVARPGYAADIDDEKAQLFKAEVEIADPPGIYDPPLDVRGLNNREKEAEARRRAAAGKGARAAADLAMSVEEAVANEGSEEAVRVWADLAPDDLRRLAENTPLEDLPETLWEIARERGIERVERAGELVSADPALHRLVDGGRPEPGERVVVLRPGARAMHGQRALYQPAIVYTADPGDDGGRKHLPGQHDQSSHGRRGGARSAAASAARWLTPDDAMEMRKQMLAGDPWTPEQQDALNQYTGSAYGEMNGLLRGDDEATADLSEGEKAEFAGLIRDAAQGMRPTTQPVRVKRFVAGFDSFGLDMSQLTRDEATEALKAMKGKTLQEPGFMSTSLRETYGNDSWLGRFKIELDVPAGAQGAYLDGDVGFQLEQELLLAPGTRFEITDVDISPPRNTVKGRVVVP